MKDRIGRGGEGDSCWLEGVVMGHVFVCCIQQQTKASHHDHNACAAPISLDARTPTGRDLSRMASPGTLTSKAPVLSPPPRKHLSAAAI